MQTGTKIPRCMSTQHPDNVNVPFFAESAELGGEDEIQEAYYVFSHLGCDEQMWDCEGKEVDNFVVKKLLTKYDLYFKDHRIGRDVFITPRVPNPTVEKEEAKILLETLESIPRSFDTAKLFYGDDIPPIFEVILPMTASAKCLDRVYRYYRDFVVGKQVKAFRKGDITIAEWIGRFEPERINVIPLFEELDHMLNAHKITREYLEDKEIFHQRVFLARSDPAMNYGFISAVLINKIALFRLQRLEEESTVRLYPIIGIGSVPFRGGFRPETVERVMDEYPSVQTFTVQSSFKYDNPPEKVRNAIEKIKERKPSKAHEIDEKRCLEIVEKYSKEYRNQVTQLAMLINEMAKFVPSRRKRKLHIGLFGYSRSIEGVKLPRAITFTSALYSIGLPPEVLGLNALDDRDLEFLRDVFVHFDDSMKDALRYLNPDSLGLVHADLKKAIARLDLDYEIDETHRKLTCEMVDILRHRSGKDMSEILVRAAHLRGFLG
ncbi:MAG: phosphoenolpyruvate carboxylase [Methanomassiliicoccales archaeon]|nr:phosphoenolpyruvate carboxylase [Methanomassiliicoccales archaeon]